MPKRNGKNTSTIIREGVRGNGNGGLGGIKRGCFKLTMKTEGEIYTNAAKSPSTQSRYESLEEWREK